MLCGVHEGAWAMTPLAGTSSSNIAFTRNTVPTLDNAGVSDQHPWISPSLLKSK
jgi:hypothetical protein